MWNTTDGYKFKQSNYRKRVSLNVDFSKLKKESNP